MSEPLATQPRTNPTTSFLSSKILNQHLERLAIVYVRQSSTKQVEENIESTQLQYRLVDRAAALGWPRQRIEIIDQDLGVSGRSIEGRAGFQRLPKNRLVAAELERRWEASLLEQRQAEEALDRLIRQQPSRLTAEETARIRALADDIPALWQAPSTSGVERQTILRALVEQVVVEVMGRSERLDVSIRWTGGFESRHEIRRAVGKFEQLESADVIRARIVALKQQGWSHAAVAAQLNAEYHLAASGRPFTGPIVSQLCSQFRAQGLLCDGEDLPQDGWRLRDLAKHLGIKPETLSTWRRRGWVHAERISQRWHLWADADELARLRQLAEYNRSGLQRTPRRLTTPKKRGQTRT